MKGAAERPPRRLVRYWTVVRDGMPAAGRYYRYIALMLPALIGIWAMVAAYLLLAPTTYTSSMTLILPGSGVGGSINLETIGQASAQTSSAFSSSTLSPTENYKRLLTADIILREAAVRVGGIERLPAPTVKLVDQTNLITVSIDGSTPAIAQRRLSALLGAFLRTLTELRQDEARKREIADRGQLAELEAKVREAQKRLLQFQGETGLATLEQFNNRVGVLDGLRNRERETSAALEGERVASSRLAGSLRAGPNAARKAMILKADPLFQALLVRYASTRVDVTRRGATLGERHIDLAELSAEQQSLRAELVGRGRQLTGLDSGTLLGFADLSVSEGRARMFETLVTADSHSSGTAASLREIRSQINRQAMESGPLVQQASRLADLLRDHRIAEAVFSSALARLDTNKSDPFASYPLVQTLEPPTRPTQRSSPSVLMALAGGVAASFLIIAGFFLIWLRQPLIRRILPKS